MGNINNLVRVEVNKYKFRIPLALEEIMIPKYITEYSELQILLNEKQDLQKKDVEKILLNKRTKPILMDGQFAVAMKEKLKEHRMNPRTNRMKNFKKIKWYVTDIKPEDRTLKNLPRYATKKAKIRFQDWLMLDRPKLSPNKYVHSVGRSPNGKVYGWSHRAIHGFKIGEIIKPDVIGNKYQYGEGFNNINDETYDKKYKEAGNFKPYIIKTEQEAEEHAIRFANDVS